MTVKYFGIKNKNSCLSKLLEKTPKFSSALYKIEFKTLNHIIPNFTRTNNCIKPKIPLLNHKNSADHSLCRASPFYYHNARNITQVSLCGTSLSN